MSNLIVHGEIKQVLESQRPPQFESVVGNVSESGLEQFAEGQRVLVMTEETLTELLEFDPVWCVVCGRPVDNAKAIFCGGPEDSEWVCLECHESGDEQPAEAGTGGE